jgi:uncharacterized protein YndB with AHSA1/START domain
MDTSPLILEHTYNAPADKIWKAITDAEQMKKWYLDVPGFKPEVGHKFEFWGGDETNKLKHFGEVKEVVEGKKISYSWRFEGYPGDSLVTWELFPEGDRTRLVLTHEGIETFRGDLHPEMKRENFMGWSHVLDTMLKDFVEKQLLNSEQMDTSPFIIERTFNAPSGKVWKAITDARQMKQWYFDLPDFKPETGYKFEFWGEDGENRFLHLCEVKEVVDGKKLSHTWRYDGYPGDSLVTWELFPEGDKTRVVLTHTDLETFDGENHPSFRKENFIAGWTDIVGTSLKEFVEK